MGTVETHCPRQSTQKGMTSWYGQARYARYVQNDGHDEYSLRDHDGMICVEYAECNWSLYYHDYPLWGDSTSNSV